MTNIELSTDRRAAGLIYSSPCRTVFAQLSETFGASRVMRIYFRDVDVDEYRPVGGFASADSLDDPTVCNITGRLIINVMTWSDTRHGSDWSGVYAFDPTTGERALLLDEARLRSHANEGRRAWVSKLLRVSGDALECVCGFSEPPIENTTRMQYWVSRIDLRTCATERITRLTKIFL